jgi:DNA-binding CsgD family transcriptional regulator
MREAAAGEEVVSLAQLVHSPAWLPRALGDIACIGCAAAVEDVLVAFKRAAASLGGQSAVFVSVLRHESMVASYRMLSVCDPVWSAKYARERWFQDNPWMRHALHNGEPTPASAITLISLTEEQFATAAAEAGFSSAVIAPAPSSHGSARFGVLALGASTPGFFEEEGYDTVRVLARALAMELHAWMARSMRRDLMERGGITKDDIELLHHAEAGHGSKFIATAQGLGPKTVDCRFQRLNSKLGAPSRRAAVELARLYGLI